MAQTTFAQKIGLFFFSLGVTLLILEAVLRLGGWVFLSLQEGKNRQNLSVNGEYRILCLGESTTALGGDNSYPRQLERILNSRQNKIKFKVINKGVPSTTTDQILSRVGNYFTEYQPQMVVAMMGINDPQNRAQWTWRDKMSRYSKAFKLFDMIARHWDAKQKEVSQDFVEKQIAKLESQAVQNPSLRVAAELGKANLYRSANLPQKEKEALDKVLALDAENSQAWFLLGIHYDREAEYQKALEAYRKADLKAGPESKFKILERMAECHKFLGDENAAVQIYLGILKQWPRHPEANGALADILMGEEKYQEAIGYFLRQVTVDPQKADIFDKLAHCYRKIGQPQKAEEILKQRNQDGAVGVGKAQGLGDAYNSATKENYLKLVKMSGQHQALVLAVQYPRRPIAPLKTMLSSVSGVVFVDNQKVFTDALAEHKYDEIFTDRFAGDFGHCTPQGNALLAGNIADHILKIVQ